MSRAERDLGAAADRATIADRMLARLTTLRLGGPARRLVDATTDEALVEAVLAADAAGEPLLLVAGGSNLVIADEGFDGVAVRVGTRGVALEAVDGRVRLTVAAGEPWDGVVARCAEEGLAGVECLAGIPGSTGATPIQNVGAYGQQVADTIVSVRVCDRGDGRVVDLPARECGFGYRTSRFRHSARYLVLGVTFSLERSEVSAPIRYPELARTLGVAVGERAPLGDVREAVLGLRRGKGMVVDPGDPDSVSAGSFFVNPVMASDRFDQVRALAVERLGAQARPPAWPEGEGSVKTSAAWLIERAGFHRGYGTGRAGISSKHTLALVNRGGATTAELIALAREIQDGVERAFGVTLQPEPTLVGVSL